MLLVRQKTRKLWQFPGGIIAAGENSRVAALREVREETNLRPKRLKRIHTEIVLTGGVEEIIDCYVGVIGKTKAMSPDGKEIDMIKWTSMQNMIDFQLTNTTKVLMTNLTIIKLFV